MIDIQLHEPVFPYDPDLVKWVKVIAFNEYEQLLAVRQGRKYGILCGKLEWDDEDTEDAARREVIEAANIILGPLAVSAVIEAKRETGEPDYTLVYSGRVVSEEPLLPKQKRVHRFIKKSSLLKNTEKPLLRELIDRAEFYLPDLNENNLRESHVASCKH